MKLRINDTLVTIKPNNDGIEATIWEEYAYTLQFDNLKDFVDNIEKHVIALNENQD